LLVANTYAIFCSCRDGSSIFGNLVKNLSILPTDPVTAEILKSKENPGGNITGTSDMILFRQQLDFEENKAQ
jgi:hypothetical protein